MSEQTPSTPAWFHGGNPSLSSSQYREVQQIAELETRRYFDHYLKSVWPLQQSAIEKKLEAELEAHNTNTEAHGRIELKVSRLIWVIVGSATAGGASAATLTKAVMSVWGG